MSVISGLMLTYFCKDEFSSNATAICLHPSELIPVPERFKKSREWFLHRTSDNFETSFSPIGLLDISKLTKLLLCFSKPQISKIPFYNQLIWRSWNDSMRIAVKRYLPSQIGSSKGSKRPNFWYWWGRKSIERLRICQSHPRSHPTTPNSNSSLTTSKTNVKSV